MEKAVKCFKTCYELEPNNINVLLQLFYQSIIGEEYEDALKYFDGIFNSNDSNDNNIADNYLYLYLLGYITDIPDKYKNGDEIYLNNPLNISRYIVNNYVGKNYEYIN